MRTNLFRWFCLTISLLGSCQILAQCPSVEGDIQFISQSEVEQFLIDYPNCTSIDGRLVIGSNSTTDINNLTPFQNLTSVKGLLIQSTSITNLNGFDSLTSIEEELSIRYNNNLVDLLALSNLTTVGNLSISGNGALTNMEGLNNITNAESLTFSQNNSMPNLNGLTGLTTLSGNLEISFNPALTSLQGLNNLTEIGGGVTIKINAALTSFDGLDNLTEVATENSTASFFVFMNATLANIESLSSITSFNGASLNISNNNLLPSLAGLDNIDPESISNLYLQASPNLSACSAPTICSYLGLGRPATISDNSVGCNSVSEVESFCEVSTDCPSGDVILTNQAQVDLFESTYPDCTTIFGNLYIGIGEGTSDINDISGLGNIEGIVGGLVIENTSLTNLTGLNSLVQTGDDFIIAGNDLLQNLQALSALTSINTSALIIYDNGALTSLSGLDNINPESITSLTLSSSQNLSTCDVESICTYISTFSSVYSISGNATGCNSFEEVLEACQDTLPTCPSANIQFISQAELDHFLIQYPNCEQINGSIKIGTTSVTDISDLQPLNNLKRINGSLSIDETSLVNLNGLENLNQTGNFQLLQNELLESVEGLDNLTTVIGSFTVQSNPVLVNFEGLSSLLRVFDLVITDNEGLTSLEGLNNLMAANHPDGGLTSIGGNPSLIDLSGLESLQLINGTFRVNDNESLTSLNGLDNLQTIADNLEIKNNPSLQSIESLGGLTEVPFLLHIGANPMLESLQGLHNLTSAYVVLINGNHSLTSLEGLNSLTTTENVDISQNNSLTSLDGLENLSTLSGVLNININNVLNDLTALSNLTQVEQLVIQGNPVLESLSGLEGLHSIFGLWPGIIVLKDNPSLNSIEALINVEDMDNGDIFVINNSLASLAGLDNIDPSSINHLELSSSQNLSVCNVPSICNFLSNGGTHTISGNATGCNSSEEVLALCELSIEEISDTNQITFYPVPAKQVLNISVQNSAKIESVNVYDMTGKLVLNSNNSDSKINLSHLFSGTYLISVKTNKGVHTEKIIKK